MFSYAARKYAVLQSVKKSVKIGVPIADDSTVTHSHKNLKYVMEIMEREVEKVLIWLYTNKLFINLKKTHLMVFTNKPPFERLKKFMKSFFKNEIRMWNSLSDFVNNSKKINEFKTKMKIWLLHNS